MFGFHYIFLSGVLAVSLTNVYGLTKEEINAINTLAFPFMIECGKDYGVTEKDFKAAEEAQTLQNLNPCILSCVFKKFGLFDSKGMFAAEIATELTMKLLNGDDDQKKVLGIIRSCASVNDKTVGDGDKGCERAAMLYECYLPLRGSFPATPLKN